MRKVLYPTTGPRTTLEWGLTAVGNPVRVVLRSVQPTPAPRRDTFRGCSIGYNTYGSGAGSTLGVTEDLGAVFRGKTVTARKWPKITPSRALCTEYGVSRGHQRDQPHPWVGASSPRRLEPVWGSMSKIWRWCSCIFGVHPKSWLLAPAGAVPA